MQNKTLGPCQVGELTIPTSGLLSTFLFPQLPSSPAKLLLPRGSLTMFAGPLCPFKISTQGQLLSWTFHSKHVSLQLLCYILSDSPFSAYILQRHAAACCVQTALGREVLRNCLVHKDFLMLVSPAARHSCCFWVLILISE